MLKKRQIFIGMTLGLILFFVFLISIFPYSSMTHFFKSPSFESTYRLNKIQSLTEHPIHWTVQDIDGEAVILKEGFKKGLVINLWATWCPPCIEELPSLSDLAEKLGDDGLVVALTTEPLKKVQGFIKSSFPDLSPRLKIVSLTKEEQNRVFPSDNLPVTYLFNQKGLLVEKIIGAKDWRTFQVPEE